MGKKTTRTKGKKLSIKKETLRKLTNLTDDELRYAAGGDGIIFSPLPPGARPPTVTGRTFACPPGTSDCGVLPP